MRRWALGGLTAALALVAGTIALPASASLTDGAVVSANPANYTPNVNDGAVTSIAKVGNTMVAVGKFSSVTDLHGAQFSRTNIFAFNADTGEVSTSFKPAVNGVVNRVVAAGDGSSVYIAGGFTTVNGQAASHVARVAVADGQLVSGFKAAATNGVVNDMVLSNDRLYIGGAFKKVGPNPVTLLAALNPSTGANTGAVNSTFADVFNGGTITVKALDVSPNGSRLVVVGNFRTVDGQTREQIAMLDTSTNPATLDSWATGGFDHACAANAFDTYMRDISMSTDGRYFVVATTGAFDGGANNNSLCDTITRWELGRTGGGQQPSWTNYSGGDTFYAVSAIGRVVYVGGHNRWVNNPYAGDAPGAGAVDREGMSAFDARNGLPFSWNPGRARGVGLREFLAVDDGLWVAHDTNRLGGETRKRIAFLPVGGVILPPENVGTLPGNVYTVGQLPGASPHWVARINTGGPTLGATDNGPDWSADRGDQPSPYRNGNSNDADWGDLPFTTHDSVPGYVPIGVFSTERWSPNDDPSMQWDIPAPVNHSLTVNLYFANGCNCTENAGQRSFDVFVEGSKQLDNYDIVADVGDQRGVLKSFDITSDGNVDIDFGHRTENPLINGIEVIDNDVAAPAPGDSDTVTRHPMSSTGTTAGPTNIGTGGENWGQDRGAFMIDGKVYYGEADGTFQYRTFNGSTFGNEVPIELNLAKKFGTNNANHTFINDLPNVTGMFYDKASARIYYTLTGQSQMFYRYFLPESRVVGAVRIAGPSAPAGVNWSNVSGMFLAGGELYFGDRFDGSLDKVDWNGGAPSGTVTPVSTNGHDWRARGTFLYAG